MCGKFFVPHWQLQELGSFCCTTGHELKRKIFALPRRNSVLRQVGVSQKILDFWYLCRLRKSASKFWEFRGSYIVTDCNVDMIWRSNPQDVLDRQQHSAFVEADPRTSQLVGQGAGGNTTWKGHFWVQGDNCSGKNSWWSKKLIFSEY